MSIVYTFPMTSPGGLRERKKKQTHQAIQSAALDLFEERGFNNTTVDQIAATANVSAMTFYRYFGTKEATVVEIFPVMDIMEPLPILIPALSQGEAALETALTEITNNVSGHWMSNLPRRISLIHQYESLLHAAWSNWDVWVTTVTEKLPEILGPDIVYYVRIITSCALQAMLDWGESPDFPSNDALIKRLAHALAIAAAPLPALDPLTA